ncbi:hypothetical protein HPB48_012045 [Haemaphysalis longicornis]|uniref:Uncharacterized protein n=1 Tax=Haemaphysalis longicornis TaxID=44386 RepID=A0A9J6GBY3_HAELO|nr:hypothetical protein HPB48_012045 [Haemaphysalis longicornis]
MTLGIKADICPKSPTPSLCQVRQGTRRWHLGLPGIHHSAKLRWLPRSNGSPCKKRIEANKGIRARQARPDRLVGFYAH